MIADGCIFPIDRMHALFTLKTVKGDIEYFLSCLSDESVLLKHEVLYCIGQMQDATVIPNLIAVLQDTQEHVVSRHEAGKLFNQYACEFVN